MKWERIAIHHTAGQDRPELDTEALRRFHVGGRGWSDIGYHWLVELVGTHYAAVMGRPMYHVGAHVRGRNRGSVGVAFVGLFTEQPPPSEQLIVGARLVTGLLDALGLPVSAVVPHRELAMSPTECPGDAFPWDEFVGLIQNRR